jgi:hypothetical protein
MDGLITDYDAGDFVPRAGNKFCTAHKWRGKKFFSILSQRASLVDSRICSARAGAVRHAFPRTENDPFDNAASRRKIGPSDRLKSNRFENG